MHRIQLLLVLLLFNLLLFKVGLCNGIDSLLLELQKSHHDTIKFDLLLEIGDLYYFSEPDKAISYFTEAKELAEKNLANPENHKEKYLRQKAKAIHYIAYVYSNRGDFITALEKQLQVLYIGEKIGCNLLIYNSYNSIGIINYHRKNFDVAMDYFKKALEITESMNHDVGSVKLYNNLGSLNRELGKRTDSITKKLDYFKTSLDFFNKTLEIRVRLNDRWGQALCYNNLGKLKMDGATHMQDKSMAKSELLEALTYFHKAIDIANEVNDNLTLSKVYASIAEIYLQFYDDENTGSSQRSLYADSAIYLATESYRLAEELNALPQKHKAADVSKKIHSKLGNLEEALNFANLYILAGEELFSEEKTKSLDELRIRYETEKNENEIKILSQANELNEIKIRNAKRARTTYIIIATSFLVLSVLLYMLYYNRKRTGNLLQEKNIELYELNTTKDKFISILAHDLKNPFSAFINIVRTLNDDYEKIDTCEKKDYIAKLYKSAEQLNSLLKNMLKWASIKHKSTNSQLVPIKLRENANVVINALSGFANEYNCNITNNIPDNINVLGNASFLTAVFNNLITNAIKFSKEDCCIHLNAVVNNSYAEISVKDNGIGISQSDINKLFRIDINTHTIGSSHGKGTGMGLILCKELISKMDGVIWAKSVFGKGSVFIFTLPLTKEHH